MESYHRCSTLQEASAVLGKVVLDQDGGDDAYYRTQLNRYLYSIERILTLRPSPCRVLDIGSHYLHQATLLSLLGYDVCGLDVPLFTEAEFVRERASAMNICNISSNGHQSGRFLEDREGCFDLVVCTEMLEHIAFNPVAFWHRVWQLLDKNGMIYLTTPNAFRVRQLLKTLWRLVTLKGIGLPVDEILDVITYGHHWKEYSSKEIHSYFKRLSPDFSVETRTYPDAESQGTVGGRAVELIPWFRTNVEAVVRLRGKTSFLSSPVLPMTSKVRRRQA